MGVGRVQHDIPASRNAAAERTEPLVDAQPDRRRTGLDRYAFRRVLAAVCVGLALAGFIAAYVETGFHFEAEGGDGWNYLAAGERLNAGHPLYALSPGDRNVVIVPPYWTVPLLAPPPVAVIWRPLALLGEPSMLVWGIANMVATIATVLYLCWTNGLFGIAATAFLSAPLGLLALSGNVNGFVLAALVAAWSLRSNPVVVGGTLAFAIAMKLTPVLFLLWLIGHGRRPAALATIAGLVVVLAISVVGAGFTAHLDWLQSVPGSRPSPQSLMSLTGLSSSAIFLLSAAAVAVVTRLGDERITFTLAAILTALASPAFYFQAVGLLLAAVAPWRDDLFAGRRLRGGTPTTPQAT